ncbi:rCG28044 [Rattus norvegicus]|uniref:RCG28044 n=1 Tax=Rattus norvegicus TaxID=10116 RepID=A6IFA9_RAT|nr:rCG28044 [Rattus norvegicus]
MSFLLPHLYYSHVYVSLISKWQSRKTDIYWSSTLGRNFPKYPRMSSVFHYWGNTEMEDKNTPQRFLKCISYNVENGKGLRNAYKPTGLGVSLYR